MAREDGFTRFCRAAARLGVEIAAVRYPEETRTAPDAAAAIGCDVAQIVKSLVFASATEPGDRPSGGPEPGPPGPGPLPVLALTSGANRVDPDRLSEISGVAIRRADADEARRATGFAIGGTPPFGHPVALPTYLDRALLDHEVVWAAAGAPDAVFPIPPERLVDLSRATVADFVV